MKKNLTFFLYLFLPITISAQGYIEKQRLQLLDMCEAISMAYNIQDSICISKYFGENCLFLENRYHTNDSLPDKNSYIASGSYRKFWGKLKKAWRIDNNFKCKLDEISIKQSPKNLTFYGMSFRQVWENTKYCDISYMFLVIEVRDGQEPIIHACVWSNEANIRRDRLPSLSDFDI